ncbi:MAG: ferrous iron transport protein A [Firmicutes bacterium]|jgi:Fe2+ transport system protein FeoA|nr:ferrous iron transport protein A [Bacillota bacterium]
MIKDDRLTSLDGLDLGERGTIIRVGCPGPLRRRLMDMGLTPGTEVRLEGVAPLGDPIIVSARGSRLGLRRAEAASITVSPWPDSACTDRCRRRHGRGWSNAASRRMRVFRAEVSRH